MYGYRLTVWLVMYTLLVCIIMTDKLCGSSLRGEEWQMFIAFHSSGNSSLWDQNIPKCPKIYL